LRFSGPEQLLPIYSDVQHLLAAPPAATATRLLPELARDVANGSADAAGLQP
jgi:hypothetical protein